METVGERLRWSHQRHVWSQMDLSNLSGVPVVTISRIENNRHGLPKPSTARKLSRALGIDPAWLLYGEAGLDSDGFRPERHERGDEEKITRLESAQAVHDEAFSCPFPRLPVGVTGNGQVLPRCPDLI